MHYLFGRFTFGRAKFVASSLMSLDHPDLSSLDGKSKDE